MSGLRLEHIFLVGLCLQFDVGLSNPINHELSSLLNHRQLLLTEMSRLYMEPMIPETQMLLDDLQQRDHQLQMQIELIEAGSGIGAPAAAGGENIAINLTADFEHLQRKLDELKHQLEKTEHVRDLNGGTTTTTTTTLSPSTVNSYFWTSPLLAMPDFPASAQPNNPPSLIKRLLAILRPNGSNSSTSSNWRNLWQQPVEAATTTNSISAEDLLRQLKKQRDFLDQTIMKLELLAPKKA
ncbi:uncharacterized protein [Drosophila tropicalis]|uniref:uncharacterized protein n=1 Tax=Drosophila tropicalis TaxID=46794 RepID=UPI0035ABAD2E